MRKTGKRADRNNQSIISLTDELRKSYPLVKNELLSSEWPLGIPNQFAANTGLERYGVLNGWERIRRIKPISTGMWRMKNS